MLVRVYWVTWTVCFIFLYVHLIPFFHFSLFLSLPLFIPFLSALYSTRLSLVHARIPSHLALCYYFRNLIYPNKHIQPNCYQNQMVFCVLSVCTRNRAKFAHSFFFIVTIFFFFFKRRFYSSKCFGEVVFVPRKTQRPIEDFIKWLNYFKEILFIWYLEKKSKKKKNYLLR